MLALGHLFGTLSFLLLSCTSNPIRQVRWHLTVILLCNVFPLLLWTPCFVGVCQPLIQAPVSRCTSGTELIGCCGKFWWLWISTISHQYNEPSASTILLLLIFEHWDANWSVPIRMNQPWASTMLLLMFEIWMHSETLTILKICGVNIAVEVWTLRLKLNPCNSQDMHMPLVPHDQRCPGTQGPMSPPFGKHTLYALLRNGGAKIFIRSRCRGSCVYWIWSSPPHSLLSSSLAIPFRASAHPP